MTRSLLAALVALPFLAACGDAGLTNSVGDLKTAAVGVASDAAKAATDMIDTRTACTLAGQSEAFCGCLQAELGPRIDERHVDMVRGVVVASLDGGVQEAVKSATNLDPETRQALTRCAVQGAIGGAMGEAAGQ